MVVGGGGVGVGGRANTGRRPLPPKKTEKDNKTRLKTQFEQEPSPIRAFQRVSSIHTHIRF